MWEFLAFVIVTCVLFYQFGRLEGRLKHIQDTLARIEEDKKGKK
jgi:hypothetical protein